MARFNGSNNQTTLEQFINRADFSANAYGQATRDLIYPLPIKDFNFAERVLYGRVSKAHNPIFLTSPQINLGSLAGQDALGPTLQAVNFVADAFDKLLVDWRGAAARGKITTEAEYLVDITPARAYIDYRKEYEKYRTSLKNSFLNTYLTRDRKKNIIDFESFMKLFMEYLLDISTTVPVTATSFITSKYAGPLISGLCIDLATFDASDDSKKEEFINSPNFEFYKLVARLNGFSIDKQVPWRLVADIASPEMLKFSQNYGQRTEMDILSNYYARAGGKDIFDMQQLALEVYNTLVTRSPVVRTPTSLAYARECGDRYITREPENAEGLLQKYSIYYWVDNYITIRYNEQKETVSTGALQEVKKISHKIISSTASEKVCINYINNSIRTFDNFKGSYAHRVLDRQNSRTGNRTQSTY